MSPRQVAAKYKNLSHGIIITVIIRRQGRTHDKSRPKEGDLRPQDSFLFFFGQ
jgi:hypothetical protein